MLYYDFIYPFSQQIAYFKGFETWLQIRWYFLDRDVVALESG